MWRRKHRAKEGSSRPVPIAQLKLVAAELDRELSNVSARQANAVTRASIVLAAAGVTAFSVVSTFLGLALVPASFSLISAFLCLAAIRYWRSKAIQLKRAHVAPYLDASPYDLLWRQVIDKFIELDAARSDLKKKSKYLRAATAMLVLAWLSAVAVRFLVEPLLTGVGY